MIFSKLYVNIGMITNNKRDIIILLDEVLLWK